MNGKDGTQVTSQNLDEESFGKVQERSLEVLARSTSEQPLAGGAAKSKALDKKILDNWIDEVGMANVRKFGVSALEADWIATGSTLFYVTPNANSVIPFLWSSIDEINVVRRRALSSEMSINANGESKPFMLKVGKTSGVRLLELWKTFRREP